MGLDDAEQMVQAVRENLRTAQSRQKSYADGIRRDLTFSVGDHVYLKVSPMRGIRRFNVKGEVSTSVCWSIQGAREERRSCLSPGVAHQPLRFHDVFHISQLKKCLRVPEEQAPLDGVDV